MTKTMVVRERRLLYMGEDSENNKKSVGKKIFDFLNLPIIATIVGSIVSVIVLTTFAYIKTSINTFIEIPSRLDDLESRITKIETSLGIEDDTDQEKDYSQKADDGDAFIVSLDSSVILSMKTEDEIKNMWLSMSNLQYTSKPTAQIVDPVAYDKETAEEYTVERLAEEKLLLNYADGKQQVFFYGQFDQDGHWTGNCIINIYENEKLTLITDAEYDHGTLLRFKQVFPYITFTDIPVWVISDRTMETGFSNGETVYYIREADYSQTFSSSNVTAKNIISADMFRENIAKTMEGYYYGNISDGYFNDDTGRAYLVKFFEDGTVKTLYMGKIKNGVFDDKTGNAWMIGKNNIDQKEYAYYKGPFNKGNASLKKEYWNDHVSLEWINEFLNDYTFDCELKWEATSPEEN